MHFADMAKQSCDLACAAQGRQIGLKNQSELKSLMVQVRRRNGERLPTEKEVGDVMNDLDVDGDGKIERQEFQALIRQVLE